MSVTAINKHQSSPLVLYRAFTLAISLTLPAFAYIHQSTNVSQSFLGWRLALAIPSFLIFALSFRYDYVRKHMANFGAGVLFALTAEGLFFWHQSGLATDYFITIFMAFACGYLLLNNTRNLLIYCAVTSLTVTALCIIEKASFSGLYICMMTVWSFASYIAILDRKRTRNDLSSSLSLLRTTLDSTCDGILVTDNDGKFVVWNQTILDILDLQQAELETYSTHEVMELIIPKLADPENFLAARTQAIENPAISSKKIFSLKNGRTIEAFYQPRRSGTDIVGRVWSFRDITDIRHTQAALEQRVELEKCFAEISARFLTLPLSETDSEINRDLKLVANLLGFDRAYIYLRGSDWMSACRAYEWHNQSLQPSYDSLCNLPEDYVKRWVEELTIRGVIDIHSAAGDPGTLQLGGGSDGRFELKSTFSLPLTREGITIGILGFDSIQERDNMPTEDITMLRILGGIFLRALDRKKHESDAKMRELAMNTTSDQIVITDANGDIVFANKAFEQQTGYSFGEVVGKNPRFLKSGQHKTELYTDMWKTINQGGTWNGEITNRCKNGDVNIVDMTINPVKDDADKILYYVAIKRNITEKKAYQERLYRLAHHDPLTGLPNRLLFSSHLAQTLAQARKRNQKVAVLFFDLDRFKNVNDSLGHKAGDMLLKQVSERLTSVVRKADTFARMGGDEFTIVLGSLSSPDEAAEIADRTLAALSEPFMIEGHDIILTASIGISMFPYDGVDVETLVMNADTAMYRAKERGKNRYHFYTDGLSAAAMDRMQLENSLHKALSHDEFVLHYQPRIDLYTGDMIGPEALIRWKHPELGLVSPLKFIPLAEETGLIVQIGEWAMKEACRQNKEWQDAGLKPMNVSVNVSAKQLNSDLVETVSKALEDSRLDPQYLSIEITETTLMYDPDLAIEVLQMIRAMGVKILVDDFGTGHSSLSYVKQLPIDGLKLDRSFVCEIQTAEDGCVIPEAVIAIGHSLKLKITAEGVETEAQLETLRSLGCDAIQGYLISRPVPATEYARYLTEFEHAAWNSLREAA